MLMISPDNYSDSYSIKFALAIQHFLTNKLFATEHLSLILGRAWPPVHSCRSTTQVIYPCVYKRFKSLTLLCNQMKTAQLSRYPVAFHVVGMAFRHSYSETKRDQ